MKHFLIIILSCLLISSSLGQEKKERHSNSDYFQIKYEVQSAFKLWLEKGEFEKSKDFQDRVVNISARAFDSICYKVLVRNFNDKRGFSSTLLKYDADSERFGIESNFNGVIFRNSLNIPIKDASKFKDEFENLEIHVDDKDWGFVDGYLTPAKIKFFIGEKMVFELSFTNKDFSNISFSTSELGFNLSNGVSHKFIFNEFYNKKIFALGHADQGSLERRVQGNSSKNNYEDKVFTKVDNEAQFPGGNAAWVRYVQKKIDSFNPANNGAAPGKYQVIVRFIVGQDGGVSHVTAETNYGHGMEEVSKGIIQNGPNWKPALQNGRNVKAYRRQTITFVVDEKN